MSGQGFTVAEAAKALGVSERTIRRQIKGGKIKAELVSGRYGEEYRIDLEGARPREEPAKRMLSNAVDTALDKASDKSLDRHLDKALDMVKSLQQEKAELYAQVAYWQAQCRHLEEQVKLLTAPKRPWWQRWLRRR